MAKKAKHKGSNGLRPLWNKKQVKMFFEKAAERAEFIIENLLARTGEEFVKVARLEGNYIDHTGNLRSSIGYVVLKDGKPISMDFQISDKAGTDKHTGKREGEQFALSLANLFPKGYVLICVAGMKYAAFVEAMENKDVVSLAADKAQDFIKEQSRSLFNQLAA